MLPFEHQWKTQLSDTYGVTSYGSGWKKDIEN